MSDTELQGAHDYGADTDTDTDQAEPGRFRRLLASVGRGLRAIFRPAVIATLAAVVAAGALVVVAVEQREQTDSQQEQTDWQRRQTCLAWWQIVAVNNAGLNAGDAPDIGLDPDVFEAREIFTSAFESAAAEECGGHDDETPGAER